MGNDVRDWTGLQTVNLINAAGASLGDVATPTPPPDTVTETLLGAPLTSSAAGALASFKAAAGSVVAPVGVFGAPAEGIPATVTPAFGQPTTPGHLLAAWVTAASSEPTTAAAGWVKVADQSAAGAWAALWVKPNSGAGEAAPTFTCAAGHITAQLSEWSGVASVNPIDQHAAGTTATPALALANPASDAAYGDLLLLASIWWIPRLSSPAFAQSWGNQAAGGQASASIDNGFLHAGTASSFSWAVVPGAAGALPLGVRTWDYDAVGVSAPAVGAQASAVLPAVAGKTYRCAMIAGSFGVAAAPGGPTAQLLQLLDGAAVIFVHELRCQNVIGDRDRLALAGLALVGTAGNSMTLQFSAGQGAIQEVVSIGAYLE